MMTNGRSVNVKLYDLVQTIREGNSEPSVTSANICEILVLLRLPLQKIIKKCYLAKERWNSQDFDDLVQLALMGVWRGIEGVDLSKKGTVRAYLIRCGTNKVISGIRTELRRRQVETVGLPEDYELIQPEQIMSLDLGDNDLLTLYLDFIESTGGFKGAHEHVAQIKQMKRYKLRKLFHQRAAKLSENMDIARRLGMRRNPDGTSIFDDE
jgi:DNA-directed RNA polymerase specialized sigma24 family protein